MWKYVILAFVMVLMPSSVFAQSSPVIDCASVDLSQTDSRSLEKIQNICAKKQPPVATTASIREWGSISKEFGKAIAETTKELGVQVNDFLVTPAGILITVYLFWDKLGGILIGIPLLILIWCVYFRILSLYARTPEKTEVVPVFFGLLLKEKVLTYQYKDSDYTLIAGTVGALITLTVTTIVVGGVIF